MHGHWLKGYLRDGKEIEGGGGGSGGEGPLVVNVVEQDPASSAKGPLRASSGKWLDATSEIIFNAISTRGVVVHQFVTATSEEPAVSYRNAIDSCEHATGEGVEMFVFHVGEKTYYGSSGSAFPSTQRT